LRLRPGSSLRQGQGQQVDFIATDIYRIVDGRIADNWHIEDNLALLRQLGLMTP
jgi:predicted ester cyclase